MRAPKAEDHRAYRELDDIQSGAHLNAFNRPGHLRHPMITSNWERVLAVVSLAFVTISLTSMVLRALW